MYGNPETTTGGKALKFYSSIRMDIRKSDVIKDGADIIGNRTKVKIVKNKLAPPFKVAEFDIMYGTGINNESCVIDVATELDIIQKSGSWYSYNGDKIAQGKDNVRTYLQNNLELYEEIKKLVNEIQ